MNLAHVPVRASVANKVWSSKVQHSRVKGGPGNSESLKCVEIKEKTYTKTSLRLTLLSGASKPMACACRASKTHTHRTLTTDHLTAETPEVHVSITIGVIDTLGNTLQVGLVRIIRAVVARILRILPGLVVEVRALQV